MPGFYFLPLFSDFSLLGHLWLIQWTFIFFFHHLSPIWIHYSSILWRGGITHRMEHWWEIFLALSARIGYSWILLLLEEIECIPYHHFLLVGKLLSETCKGDTNFIKANSSYMPLRLIFSLAIPSPSSWTIFHVP